MGIIDTQLEKYTIEMELGQNKHFTLYQGRRKSDDSGVIIKIIAPLYTSDEFFVRRFKQIAEQVAQLEHPNILPTDEAEQTDNWLYVAQDDPATLPLAQAIENEGPFTPRRTQFIAGQLASALDYAHQKSVMHGDLSAWQVYLEPDDYVLIANFGQSQALFGTNVARHAPAITAPEILAPERVQGQGPSRQADLYALGVLCYQMLTGRPPFTGPASTILHAQAHKQPLPPHLVDACIPIGTSKAIGRMLSKSVELRYNTGAEFIRALAMAKHDSKPGHRYDHLIPLTEREQRQPAPFKTFFYLAATVIILIIFSALFGWAGYELGLKRAVAQTTSVRVVAAATIVALQHTPEVRPLAPTNLPSPSRLAAPLPTATPTEAVSALVDTLRPTPIPLVNAASSTPSPTPTPSPTTSKPTSTPPPPVQPAIPAGQTMFVFYNPTGFDMIIDLTGPTNLSELIPPDQRHEFLLQPGSYQYIAHTLTGNLQTVVGNLDLLEGQRVEKDYYSDYDWTKK